MKVRVYFHLLNLIYHVPNTHYYATQETCKWSLSPPPHSPPHPMMSEEHIRGSLCFRQVVYCLLKHTVSPSFSNDEIWGIEDLERLERPTYFISRRTDIIAGMTHSSFTSGFVFYASLGNFPSNAAGRVSPQCNHQTAYGGLYAVGASPFHSLDNDMLRGPWVLILRNASRLTPLGGS